MSQRMEMLSQWLDKVDAQLLWDTQVGELDVRCYAIGAGTAIVRVGKNDGWDIYIPASDNLRMDMTIDAAAKRLGVGGSDLVGLAYKDDLPAEPKEGFQT